MNKLFVLSLLICPIVSFAQTFAPAPGEPGTTAIHKDSSCFVAWAHDGKIVRGYIDINDTTATYDGSNRATFGTIDHSLGAPGGLTDAVSLGDSGYVTLTFPMYVTDGPGFDFAVFENGFADHFMELGHVEVSSDGIHFFRFPSVSEIPLDMQLGNPNYSDCRYVNNLAGKYRYNYGTPFDVTDLPDDALLDKSRINHVRIVDAIGAIEGEHTTTDGQGTVINDPYPTPFHSGGFDLDAVGVINGFLGIAEKELQFKLIPNPTTDVIQISFPGEMTIHVLTSTGQEVVSFEHRNESQFSFAGLDAGVYFVQCVGVSQRIVYLD